MAQPITSYSTLVAAIQETAEDTGTELEQAIPMLIDNAENRLLRELDHQILTYTSTVTASASTATFSKPAGHRITKHVKYIDPNTSRAVVLTRKTDDYLLEYWPQETSVGTPKYYAEDDYNTFRIVPCVSSDASIEIRGVRRPTALTSASDTNVFTSVVSDVLFYACMLEVATWQRNDFLFDKYTQLYTAARDTVNNEGRRSRRDDGSPIGNPQNENTLMET